MEFKQRSLMQLAQLICKNLEADKSLFRYRNSTYGRDSTRRVMHG